jgi:drug/metabolite transporter (DMT)-like permease
VQIYLWLAILIFGASSAVTRKLTQIGAQHLWMGRNPISLVMFICRYLCALILMLPIYRRQWNKKALQELSKKDWVGADSDRYFIRSACPWLNFPGISINRGHNIILIDAWKPPLAIALSVWLLRERVNRWEVVGAIAAFVGVALTILLQTSQTTTINMGVLRLVLEELLAAIAAVASVVSTIIVRNGFLISQWESLVFSYCSRNCNSFLCCFSLYGSDHFMDVFSPSCGSGCLFMLL